MSSGKKSAISHLLTKNLAESGQLEHCNLCVAERIKDYMQDAVEGENPEIVEVVTNGVTKKKICEGKHRKQENVATFFKVVLNKGCSIDMFKDIQPSSLVKEKDLDEIDDEAPFPCISDHKHFIHYKYSREKMISVQRTIRLFLGLGMAREYLYLKLLKERIVLSKKLLLHEVELGNPTLVNSDCSFDKLPQSFRYYDFTFNYIRENISSQRKEFFNLKKHMSRHFKDKSDVKQKILK